MVYRECHIGQADCKTIGTIDELAVIMLGHGALFSPITCLDGPRGQILPGLFSSPLFHHLSLASRALLSETLGDTHTKV